LNTESLYHAVSQAQSIYKVCNQYGEASKNDECNIWHDAVDLIGKENENLNVAASEFI
jgi:hypothetical protein